MSNIDGLRYLLLNLGIDEIFIIDICQNLMYINQYSQFEVLTATQAVIMSTKKGKNNCDLEVAYLIDLILKKIPLNQYSVSILQLLGQRALIGDLKRDYSKKRIALGEIFVEEKSAIVCINCLKSGMISSLWEVSKKGKLKCVSCKKTEVFSSCSNCDFPIIRIKDEINLSCRKCKESIHLDNSTSTNVNPDDTQKVLLLFMSAIYQADGRVTKNEVDQIINELKRSGFESKERKELLKFMKKNKNKFSHDDILSKIENLVKGNIELKMTFLRFGLFAASADNIYHPNEKKLIIKLVRILNVDTSIYNQIKKEIFNEEVYDIAWCYEILESNEAKSDEQIKTKYRNLYKDYHPDKFESKNLPAHIKKMIEDKVKDINFALEGLKKIRPKL